ncbi:unnamed protein product [Closterium sp. Naga37s-1]|nr:unnamed protein product [Closterium sp. Naga37s-1]
MAAPAVELGATHSAALGAFHSAAADAARIPQLSALVPASAFPPPAPLTRNLLSNLFPSLLPLLPPPHSSSTLLPLPHSSSPFLPPPPHSPTLLTSAAPSLTSPFPPPCLHFPAPIRGCHIITSQIMRAVPEIADAARIGQPHTVLHTSASLTINENASPDVPLDMEDALNRIAPEGNHYRHLDEGYDDMPAHVKSSLMGCSLTVPIMSGRFKLGMWQGIYLNEHRNYGGARQLCITIQGEKRADGR